MYYEVNSEVIIDFYDILEIYWIYGEYRNFLLFIVELKLKLLNID